MNEKCRELWRQAVLKAVLNNTSVSMNFQLVADEFARSILQECFSVLEDSYPPDDLIPVEEVIFCLKGHFK